MIIVLQNETYCLITYSHDISRVRQAYSVSCLDTNGRQNNSTHFVVK